MSASDQIATDFARALGARLRAVRMQKGLTLDDVERLSKGAWKAVVIGSYERGHRSIAVPRLAELAWFYDVPTEALLPREPGAGQSIPHVTLDLTQLETAPPAAFLVRRFVDRLRHERRDYNDRLFSVRDADLRTLATLYGTTTNGMVEHLRRWRVVDPQSRQVHHVLRRAKRAIHS